MQNLDGWSWNDESGSYRSVPDCVEPLSNRPHLTPLSDEVFQNAESFRVPRVVSLRIMNDHTFVVFRGDAFVDISSAAAIVPDILEAVEWLENGS